MSKLINPSDLGFFMTLANAGSLTAAAREQGITSAAVSRHLSQMETRLGITLINRTTRRMSLTSEGEVFLEHARKIQDSITELESQLWGSTTVPQGLLRVNATLGFGRSHIAPLLSNFAKKFPQVDLQLQLSVNPPSIGEDSFDVCFRFGNPPDSRVIAKLIAPNRRILVASPSYLKKYGMPKTPQDLIKHNCIGIRQGDEAYGLWKIMPSRQKNLSKDLSEKFENIKIRGNLTTNDGGVAVQWALDGHGVLLRAEWDIKKYIKNGELIQVLNNYSFPDADIYAIYAERHRASPRVKALTDFAIEAFANSI